MSIHIWNFTDWFGLGIPVTLADSVVWIHKAYSCSKVSHMICLPIYK